MIKVTVCKRHGHLCSGFMERRNHVDLNGAISLSCLTFIWLCPECNGEAQETRGVELEEPITCPGSLRQTELFNRQVEREGK